MSEYRVSVIDSFSEWRKISTSWDTLLRKSRANTLFLTWEWLYAWSECFLKNNRRLFILTVYDDSKLIGIAPWYIRDNYSKIAPEKRIAFLGTPETNSSYIDIIAQKGQEKGVSNALCDFLAGEGASFWDSCLLQDLPSDSLFLLHFMGRIKKQGKFAEINYNEFYPTVRLQQNPDEFISMLSTNRRKKFRHDLKVLNTLGEVEHETFIGNDRSAINKFMILYNGKKDLDEKNLDVFLNTYLSCSGKSSVTQIDMLKCRGDYVAGLFHLRFQDRLSLYLMAVNKKYNQKISVGNMFVGLCIINAIKQGFRTYDFLKGGEDYKFHWADSGRSSVDLYFCQTKMVPLFQAVGRFIKYTGKLALR